MERILLLILICVQCTGKEDKQEWDDLETKDLAYDLSSDIGDEYLDVSEIETQEISLQEIHSEEIVQTDILEVSGVDSKEVIWPPPIAPDVPPEKIKIEKWLVTFVNKIDQDILWGLLEKGEFIPPEKPGKDQFGVQWLEATPKDDGFVTYPGLGLTYAVAHFVTDQQSSIIVRADRVYRVYVNGRPQPGDVYGTKQHRIPGQSVGGDNWIAVMGWNMGGAIEVELWKTPDEVYFNTLDITYPEPYPNTTSEEFIGVPLLNMSSHHLSRLTAKVLENQYVKSTETDIAGVGPLSLTKIPFILSPKNQWPKEEFDVTIRILSKSLEYQYEKMIKIKPYGLKGPFRKTFMSKIDGSAQYYGVLPPKDYDPSKMYSMALSLHGAGVEAIGQSGAYSQKDWIFIVAPTNRRPFGFDWEEWGRLDGVEVLEHALENFPIDKSSVHITGHSMGGHGTWQLGVHFSNRFAVVGPSAGWSSFYSYVGEKKPTGAFYRARASSDTLAYIDNLANKPVYIIHGEKDDNVPISEANLMYQAVSKVTDVLKFHIEPGAGHWWDYPETEGADCVDWPELFDWMKEKKIDPIPLEFKWITPSPWVNSKYSFIRLESEQDPYKDVVVEAKKDGGIINITTSNVRTMIIDGKTLVDKGVSGLKVDGKEISIVPDDIIIGPLTGKNAQIHGPFNQIFHRPFCFVYSNDAESVFEMYASYLASIWTVISNGLACMIPLSSLSDDIRSSYNLIYVGVPKDKIVGLEGHPFDWGGDTIVLGSKLYKNCALVFVFPANGRLNGVMTTTQGLGYLLYMHQPFTSRSGFPDYVLWNEGGILNAGFFDSEWKFSQ